MSDEVVFISYAVADGTRIAKKIYNDLGNHGYHAWMDVYNIRDGFDWDAEVDRGLSEATVVIVLLTPSSVLSLQVKSEWNEALSRYIPVIPILCADCEIPRVLKMLNYVDLMNLGYGQTFQAIVEQINSLASDYYGYLSDLLAKYREVQNTSPDPGRFQHKIDRLHTTLDNWKQRVGNDRREGSEDSRIAREMVVQKSKAIEASKHFTLSKKTIVGQRLTDLGDQFFDREDERRSLSSLLHDEHIKLISVIGRGGIGKSGLVSKVLGELENDSLANVGTKLTIHGIAYLSTRTRGISLERIFHDCCQWLAPEDQQYILSVWTDSVLEIKDKVLELLSYLGAGTHIILLDNMEDLLDEDSRIMDSQISTFIEIVLTTPCMLKLIVTTRRPIYLPIALAKYDARVLLNDGLPVPEAVKLLRVLDVNGEFGLVNAKEDVLEKIVAIVRGVPRALEIVTSILANDPFLTLEELAEKDYIFSQNEFVESLVKENYRSLSFHERRILEVLSVFGRSVPVVAVEYVLRDLYENSVTPILIRRLASIHTVEIDRKQKTIHLHPIDRDYIYSQLPREMGNSDFSVQALEKRVAEYYDSVAASSKDWINAESLENQLFQFEHLVRAAEFNAAAKLMEEIDYDYLTIWGYIDRVISMRKKLLGNITDAVLNTKNLNGIGYAFYVAGRYPEVVEYCEQARKIAYEISANKVESRSLANLGRAYRYLGKYDLALDVHSRALELAQRSGDIREEGVHWGNRGRLADSLGQIHEAMDYYERGLEIARRIGDKRGISYRIGYTAEALVQLGNSTEASTLFNEAIKLAREIRYKRGECIHMNNFAQLLIYEGEYSEARELCVNALAIAREYNHVTTHASLICNLALIELRNERYEDAVRLLLQALSMVRYTGDPRISNLLHTHLAFSYLCQNTTPEARESINTAAKFENPKNNFRTSLIALLISHNDNEDTNDSLLEFYTKYDRIVALTPELFAPVYARGIAFCCDPGKSLDETLNVFQSAVDRYCGRGVVQECIRMLNLIHVHSSKIKRDRAIEFLKSISEM